MAEVTEVAKDYPEGAKPPEPPSAVVPGKVEHKEPEDGSVPPILKTIGAAVGVLSVIAGMVFGILQIVQMNRQAEEERVKSERLFQEQRAQEERTFQVELAKQQNEFKLAEDNANNRSAESIAQIEKDREAAVAQQAANEKEKAQAEAKTEDSRREEAAQLAQKVATDYQREKWEADQRTQQDERAAKIEQSKQQTQNFQTFEAAATKLRSSKTPDDAMSAITTITQYLAADGPIKEKALETLGDRLEDIGSKAEIDLIFAALPDAGFDGMDIAIRSNRKAWHELFPAIMADIYIETIREMESERGVAGRSPTQSADVATVSLPDVTDLTMIFPRPGIEEVVFRRLAPLRLTPDTSDHLHKQVMDVILGESDRKYLSSLNSAPRLESVVAELADSRDAIQKILPKAPPKSVVNLDGCFLPRFSPDRPTQAESILVNGTFLAGADLQGLDSAGQAVPSFHFGPEELRFLGPDSSLPLLLRRSPGVLRSRDDLVIQGAEIGVTPRLIDASVEDSPAGVKAAN